MTSPEFEVNLNKYAELIVKVGLNLQTGQRLVVLADIAASSYALDEAEAEAARERARQQLERAQSEAELQHATTELRRAELTIRVNRKVRASGPSIRILTDDEVESN